MTNLKSSISTGLLIFAIGFSSSYCSSDTQTQEVEYPTIGTITTVKEVQADVFKIDNEEPVQDTLDSRIIANYLDNTSDTFTLAEARLMQESGYQGAGRGGSVMRAASFGLMGYMMGRSMMGSSPAASAYTSPQAHSRVMNNTGNQMKNTAMRKTVSRPKSGFGGGRSTRSVGG